MVKPAVTMKPNPCVYAIQRLFFFAAFLLLAFTIRAQNIRVTYSKEFSIRDALSLSEGTYKIGSFYYRMQVEEREASEDAISLKGVKFGINLYQYDESMKELKKTELGGHKEKFGPFYPKIVWFNNRLLLFYFKVQDDDNIKLLLAGIDTASLTVTGTTELYTIPGENASRQLASSRQRLHTCISPDGSKLLVAGSDNISSLFSCTIAGDAITDRQTLPIANMKAFEAGNVFIDNSGNKYIAYKYMDKVAERGIVMQNGQGNPKWLHFTTGQTGTWVNDIYFKGSADNTKTYLYANYYHDHLNDGVLLATADARNFSINNIQIFPYPDSLKKELADAGYGQKVKDSYTVTKIDYQFTELENGTVALTGYPTFIEAFMLTRPAGTSAVGTTIPSFSSSGTKAGAGAIINIFIKDGKSIFTNIARRQSETDAAGCIVFGYKNDLVCIYNESRLALQPNGYDGRTIGNPAGLILAQAVTGGDGTVLSTKKIAEAPAKNYFFTAAYRALPGNAWLVPVGRVRMNLAEIYTEVLQWVTLEVE